MKSSGLARVIECSCLVWRRKNCFQVCAFRSSRRTSKQGHLFRHSFLQGTVRSPPRSPCLLECISHTLPAPFFTSTGDHCLKPQARSAGEKGVLKSVSKPPTLPHPRSVCSVLGQPTQVHQMQSQVSRLGGRRASPQTFDLGASRVSHISGTTPPISLFL